MLFATSTDSPFDCNLKTDYITDMFYNWIRTDKQEIQGFSKIVRVEYTHVRST